MADHPLLEDLDLRGRGLEIGALHHPLVPRLDVDVLYVDHASTEEIRAKYADDETVGEIVAVDVVWGDGSLRTALDEVIGTGEPVDFVVASHVIEHVPNLVGWLDELAGVLRPGGLIGLAIPDKRYCFDARRRVTDVADVIEAHLTNRTRPPLGATFDFWTKYDEVDAQVLWAGCSSPPSGPLRDREALERTRAAAASTDYSDVHCWVFTPSSFLEILHRLMDLDMLTTFVLRSFRPTAPGSLEFYVVLEHTPDTGLSVQYRQRQLASIERFVTTTGDPPHAALAVSDLERRLIMLKRRMMSRLRSRRPSRGQ